MEPFGTSLLDETAPRGARVVALALLDKLAIERERLKSEHDIDALHDFRVALRRLRSWLRVLKPTLEGSLPRGAVRRLRRIAKASNAGRDAEVFVDWLHSVTEKVPARQRGAARWLTARFERQQREADATLDELLARDFSRAQERLQARLEAYRVVAHVHQGMQEPSLAAILASRVRDQAALLRERLSLVRTADDEREAHRARIAGKQLRYLLEPVAPYIEGGEALVERLKMLQDALGDLHDAHVWLMMLREMAAEAATEEGRRLARTIPPPARSRSWDDRYPSLQGFAYLLRLAQERAHEAFDQLTAEWTKRTVRKFFRALDAAAVSLEARAREGLEIERKYLLSRMPKGMPRAAAVEIEQGYLPGQTLVERLRSERHGRRTLFFRTVKSGKGLVRTELEEETSRAVFETMWPLTQGKRVAKTRHLVRDGDFTWEVDEFVDHGLVLVEVELPSPTTAVTLPSWLAPYVEREVTGEAEFLNINLAK